MLSLVSGSMRYESSLGCCEITSGRCTTIDFELRSDIASTLQCNGDVQTVEYAAR